MTYNSYISQYIVILGNYIYILVLGLVLVILMCNVKDVRQVGHIGHALNFIILALLYMSKVIKCTSI